MISPNVDLIDRMKIQKLGFSKKIYLKFRARLWGNVWYMYVKRGKASVFVTPVLSPCVA